MSVVGWPDAETGAGGGCGTSGSAAKGRAEEKQKTKMLQKKQSHCTDGKNLTNLKDYIGSCRIEWWENAPLPLTQVPSKKGVSEIWTFGQK
ncbi:hypothetical protein ACOBR2_13525 [Telmatobacter bradus]|uniref:hypothetical protein n=1 Tax=Telmatobacter bradus TaxID=474953 RepID=UPI003B432503